MPCYENERDLPPGYVFAKDILTGEIPESGYPTKSDCEENCPTCLEYGACCQANGTCEEVEDSLCDRGPGTVGGNNTDNSGKVWNPGVQCDEVDCKWACCFPDEESGEYQCDDMTLEECDAAGGEYRPYNKCSNPFFQCGDCVCPGFCGGEQTLGICYDENGNPDPASCEQCGSGKWIGGSVGGVSTIGWPVNRPEDCEFSDMTFYGCGSLCDGTVYYSNYHGLYFLSSQCQADADIYGIPSECNTPECSDLSNQSLSAQSKRTAVKGSQLVKHMKEEIGSFIKKYSRKEFEDRCKKYIPHIAMDIAESCIITEYENGELLINERHPSFPRQYEKGHVFIKSRYIKPEKIKAQKVPSSGPGTELKKLLKRVGITASPNCSCNARARKMDQWGPDVCEQRKDEILGWLREEAQKRKLPFFDTIGKMIINQAIKRSRKKKN